jgi:hypothetical protein
VSEVSRYLVNIKQGNIDIQKIQRELENEGVELSNEKIQAIVRALKTFLFRVLKMVSAQHVEEAQIIEKV